MSQSVIGNISNYLEKHQQGARLTLTAVAASVLTASALIGYQRVTRSRLQGDKRALKRAVNEEQPAVISIIDEEMMKERKREPMDEALVLELLARNIAFFGHESVSKIRQSFVVILGAGAIGSWTALMLVRSGVEHVRIVDPGYVHLESMTRNAVAKIADIGKSKALILKKYINDIAPNAIVEVERTSLTEENMAELLADKPDFVVDTLPNVRDKVLLAKYCKEHNIKVVSAVSAGAKADPTLIQITDVNDTMTDPLARMYRRQLRKFGIDRGIPVVYSIEKSLHLDKKVPTFSPRSLPVLGPVASMFGMALVTYIIVQLAEFTAYKLPVNKMRDGVYSRLQKELAAREQVIFNNTTEVLDTKDVGYIFDEFWQGKSVISGAQDRMLVMTRWDSSKVSSLVNTVVMTKDEANLHDKLPKGTDLVAHYGSDIVEKVNGQFALEKKLEELWNSSKA
ncbi:hypothetical protein INT46_004184 [Mucor plumbeus]|uniref:THIF-type NAD/FAD binding fold domain-containing protein n=1 Tax=Mucor plumbeus TaxID=97098 RepID=A0A8H7RSN8_9FUNG|nr:hypothetical protein INT46_004184 [Mucor plumbeus]